MAPASNEQNDRITAVTAPALRQCPTLSGDLRSLITHRIEVPLCQKRQRDHYHKCHRCLYRGQPADFVVPESPRLGAVADSGYPPPDFVDLPAGPGAAGRNGHG